MLVFASISFDRRVEPRAPLRQYKRGSSRGGRADRVDS